MAWVTIGKGNESVNSDSIAYLYIDAVTNTSLDDSGVPVETTLFYIKAVTPINVGEDRGTSYNLLESSSFEFTEYVYGKLLEDFSKNKNVNLQNNDEDKFSYTLESDFIANGNRPYSRKVTFIR